MRGGESIFDIIETLHMDKFLPGAADHVLLDYEVNDRCNDLIEKVSTWTPSAPGCERYDALVLALAEQTLNDFGCLQRTPCDPPTCAACGHTDGEA